MEKILIIPILLSFFITLFTLPIWIRKAKKAGICGKNINRLDRKEVAEAGGIIVLFSFIFGILFYIAIKTFVLKTDVTTIEIFALIMTIFIAGIIGFIDDIIEWKIGLSAKVRIILLFFAAIPLMVVNAGESTMMGINFGLIYPLIFIPLGVIGASATYNFLAGYNGLEASQGILILSTFSILNYYQNNSWLSLVCLCMVACLIAFYIFNKYPTKIFPGNVLTYSVGALIASVAILGNIEKIAVFFFIPYIIETGLKVRGKLKKQSFAKVEEDGSLSIPYEKFYSLTHISIYLIKALKKKMGKEERVYETEVVYFVNLFQILIIFLGLILFKNPLF